MFVRSAGRGVHAGKYGILGSNQIFSQYGDCRDMATWKERKRIKNLLIVNFDGDGIKWRWGFLQSVLPKIHKLHH